MKRIFSVVSVLTVCLNFFNLNCSFDETCSPFDFLSPNLGFWILGSAVCDLWIFLDVCSCTSSILHIVVISIDRYLAINDPLNTRNRQQKCKILLLIILIWLIAILLSSPMIVLGAINPYNIFIDGQCLINNQFFVTYGSVVSFVIPLIIVIIMYTLTVRRLKEQIRQCQSQLAQEQIARAASLVAKPFLRRHVPARRTGTSTNIVRNSFVQAMGGSIISSRRKRFDQIQQPPQQQKQTKDDVNEENSENESFRQRGPPSKRKNHAPNGNDQLEEMTMITHDFNRKGSEKIFPHNEYACPKNPFCQLRCTCPQSEVQEVSNLPPIVEKRSTWLFSCPRATIVIPCFRFRSSNSCGKSNPISSSATTNAHGKSSPSNVNQTKIRHWRRLTIPTSSTNSSRSKSSAVRNEQKALKVLGVVFAIFVIAWFPFCIMNVLQGVCKRCSINPSILNGLVWLGYVSSTINPLVYTIFNRNFRLKFIALLRCRCSNSIINRRNLSYYVSQSSLQGSRFQRKNTNNSNESRRFKAQNEHQEFKLIENPLEE